MNLNFIYTGGGWKEQYTNAIVSALAVHEYDEAIVWYTRIKPGLNAHPELSKISARYRKPVLDVEMVRIVGQEDVQKDYRAAVQKDVLLWEIASQEGGIFLDLDTTSFTRIDDLLGDADFVSPIDIPWVDKPWIGWRNNAIVISKPGSELAKFCWYKAFDILSTQSVIRYFDLGPQILTTVVNDIMLSRHFERDHPLLDLEIVTPPVGMLGGYGSRDEVIDGMGLPPVHSARVIHWFGVDPG